MGQIRRHGLHEEQRPADVDVEGVVEVVGLDVGELVVLGDARVVDYDVDLEGGVGGGRRGEELVFRGGDEGGGALDGAEVGLHGEGADAPF